MSDSSLSPNESLIDNDCANSELDLGDILSKLNKLSIKSIDSTHIIRNNSLLTNNQIELKMVLPVLNIEHLQIIPDFDGNANKLHRFINASEHILNHYYDVANKDNFQNVLLLNGILNKLHGRAEEVVSIHGSTSWEDIKAALLQNFGDQRDENCLNQDLVNLKQKVSETPLEFHETITHLLNTICNYISLHTPETERECKKDFFVKQALKTFLAGLREPLGPIIRAMRPTSLAQAMQFISEEDNIKYYQRTNNIPNSNVPNVKKQYPQPISKFQGFNRPNYSQNQFRYTQPQRTNSQNFNMRPQNQQFPRGPINIQRNPNPPVQNFPTNSQVFKKPNTPYQPTPMSISTRNTYRQPYNGQNNVQYFNTEHINVDEQTCDTSENCEQIHDTDEFYFPYEYDDENYPSEEQTEERNFRSPPNQNEVT